MSRITVSHVEAKIDIANRLLGLDDEHSGYSRKLGSLRLYGDQTGYAVHQLYNEHGGVNRLFGYGATKRDVANYLDGLIEGLRRTANVAN